MIQATRFLSRFAGATDPLAGADCLPAKDRTNTIRAARSAFSSRLIAAASSSTSLGRLTALARDPVGDNDTPRSSSSSASFFCRGAKVLASQKSAACRVTPAASANSATVQPRFSRASLICVPKSMV